MSRKTEGGRDSYQNPASGQVRGFLARRVTRFLFCIGLAAGLAAASPMGGLAAASAAPVAAGHHVGGGGQGGGDHQGRGGDNGGGGNGSGEGGYGNGGNGNGGNGRSDHGRHHRVITVTVDGTVLSGGAGADFTLTAMSSTIRSLKGTAVTVDVTSSTKYKQPGVTSPSVTTGDFVAVTGTETSAAGTITAKSVLIPAVQLTGYVVTGGAGGNFTLTTTSTTIFGPRTRQLRSMSTSGGPPPSTRKRE